MAGYWPSSFFCVFMDRDEVALSQLKDYACNYDIIVERMQKHVKPERSALVVRYEFDNRARNS